MIAVTNAQICQTSKEPMVVVNTLYDVGARDEQDQKTGFAHLFEDESGHTKGWYGR